MVSVANAIFMANVLAKPLIVTIASKITNIIESELYITVIFNSAASPKCKNATWSYNYFN